MAKILNGRLIASQIKNEIKSTILSNPLSYHTRPTLAVILCSNDPASKAYVNKKISACENVGIKSFVIEPFKNDFEQWSNQENHLLHIIDNLNVDNTTNGILVQLPLPKNIDTSKVFDRINPLKDVDVFNPTNVGLLLQGRPRFIPCTPHGIQELLKRSDIEIEGKKVAIINRSNIVGKPLQALLIQDQKEANATVTLCHDRTPPQRLRDICQSADIIVVAVGKPDFLTPEMVNENSIVIDVGINRVGNSIVGDVHKDVYDIVTAYSPVPNGVGPMTVAMLLHNTIKAQYLQTKHFN